MCETFANNKNMLSISLKMQHSIPSIICYEVAIEVRKISSLTMITNMFYVLIKILYAFINIIILIMIIIRLQISTHKKHIYHNCLPRCGTLGSNF